MDNNVKVNDGRGLYDNCGLCDTLIIDCNNLIKQLVSGEYVLFSHTIVQMVQKIGNLKKGIKSDSESQEQQIRELQEQLNIKEGVERDAAGSVHNTLDGTVGSREERLRDVIFAEGGGLEPDPDHAGA